MPVPPPEILNMAPEIVRGSVVDYLEAPGGGYWLLGSDGGVFAVGGAPFYGSYPGLPAEARQGERTFYRIESNGQGGYRLISNNGIYGQGGEFGPAPGTVNQPTPPPPPPPAEPPPVDTQQESARALVTSTLSQFGLTLNAGTVESLMQSFITKGESGFMLDLRQTDEYKQRFPAMEKLRSKGRAVDEATYLSYEREMTGLFRRFGLPAGFYDSPDDFAQMIDNEISPVEMADRIKLAAGLVSQFPAEVTQTLQQIYGVTPGELLALALDPDKGESAIQQRIATGTLQQVGQIGGAAVRSGFGIQTLAQGDLERLVQLGITPEQAQEGFGQMVRDRELFNDLPGGRQENIEQGAALAATFEGNEEERQRIEQRRRQRIARFSGGGSFVTGGEGVTGLAES